MPTVRAGSPLAASITGMWGKVGGGADELIRSPPTSVPPGCLPVRAEWKRAEKGTPSLLGEGLRMRPSGAVSNTHLLLPTNNSVEISGVVVVLKIKSTQKQ